MKKFVIGIVLLWPCWSSGAPEAGRYQQGRVSQVEKKPCFSASDALVEPVFLEINQISDGVYTPVWSIEFTKNSPAFQLSANACITYGDTDEMSMKVLKPAGPLQPNERYSFFMNTFEPQAQGKGLVNRVYRGNFCIVADEFQQPQVHQVAYDSISGEWLWRSCLASR